MPPFLIIDDRPSFAQTMQPLALAPADTFSSVRFLLTDMDETLTHRGRLAAQTYAALERLQTRGIRVIPVTAAPAGWCDQMARMWPVDGVIAENGGLFIRRGADGHGAERRYWHADVASRSFWHCFATDLPLLPDNNLRPNCHRYGGRRGICGGLLAQNSQDHGRPLRTEVRIWEHAF